MKLAAPLAMLLGLMACQPLEIGEPPTFGGFTATTIGDNQLLLEWNLGSDDFLDAESLSYGIWVADSGGTIDPETSPTFRTKEGVTSFSLVGLQPNTEYEILVRAGERGSDPQWSDNTSARYRTASSGAGRYRVDNSKFYDLGDTPPIQLIAGKVTSAQVDTLGVVFARRIDWVNASADGVLELAGTTKFTGDILEAHLVDTDNEGYHDLFVVTASNLFYQKNIDDGTGARTFDNPVALIGTLNTPPAPGTLDFINNATDGLLITYVATGGASRITNFKKDGSGDAENPRLQEKALLSLAAANFRLAYLDDDGVDNEGNTLNYYDIVFFGPEGLKALPDNGSQYTFQNKIIDISLESGADDNQTDFETTFFATPRATAERDHAYVYLRDQSGERARLWHYAYSNQSEPYFSDGRVIDFGINAYDHPIFHEHNADSVYDLMLANANSNNIAVFEDGQTFARAKFYGVDGKPDLHIIADFAGLAGTQDLAVVVEKESYSSDNAPGVQRWITLFLDNRNAARAR